VNDETSHEKRVAFFISGYVFGSSSSIINSAIVFARNGYWVDIFLYNAGHADGVSFSDKHIDIYNLSDKSGKAKKNPKIILLKLFSKKIPPHLVRLLGDAISRIKLLFLKDKAHLFIPKHVINTVKNIIGNKSYSCFIGFESGGLIFASIIGSELNIPIIYYSLELYLSYDTRFSGIRFKHKKMLEREYHKDAVATIIQDEERAKLLFEDNKIHSSKTIVVPVSLLGAHQKNKTRYLYDRLNIPYEKKIVLQIGGIYLDTCSLEIAKAAQYLPDEWVLVMHGYYEDDLIEKIKSVTSNEKICLSLNVVPFDELPDIIASADIGLAFYKIKSVNDYYIGSSSGKLPHYLQCGLPVITIDFPSLKRIVEEYQCGISVSNPKVIGTAIKQIMSNYDRYRANAFRCYKERYEFSQHFQKVIDMVEKDLSH
jgi:glycosyltransferase involved in cell wall biosynthesis